jgi:hypothetical protein
LNSHQQSNYQSAMNHHETAASASVGGDQHEGRVQKRNSKDRAGEQQETGSQKLWGKLRTNLKENQSIVEKRNAMPPSDSKKPQSTQFFC